MTTPSTKKKVTIEHGTSSRVKGLIGSQSFKTKSKSRALEIIAGFPLAARGWFRGKLIFENKSMIETLESYA
jgi:hypothetical protein